MIHERGLMAKYEYKSISVYWNRSKHIKPNKTKQKRQRHLTTERTTEKGRTTNRQKTKLANIKINFPVIWFNLTSFFFRWLIYVLPSESGVYSTFIVFATVSNWIHNVAEYPIESSCDMKKESSSFLSLSPTAEIMRFSLHIGRYRNRWSDRTGQD